MQLAASATSEHRVAQHVPQRHQKRLARELVAVLDAKTLPGAFVPERVNAFETADT
jgi:hypothetical protein